MKTIMVVDDKIDILEEVKACLKNSNFDVITAANSRNALEIMDGDNEEDFGLILIDTLIPGSDKQAFFSMKPRSKMSIDASNMDNFLQKPFTREQLLDFVKGKIGDD